MNQRNIIGNYNLTTKLFYVFMLCMLLFTGCSSSPTPTSSDIITQKIPQTTKTQVTVLVKYAFSINGFEKALEEKFPNIDIVQVGNYTRDMGIEEYKRRLEHDDLTDIIMTWPLDVGQEYWSERLLDLSGYDFSSRYNISMLNSIAQKENLYYLPGPAQVRGIIYNKTLFKEQGWPIPRNFKEFVQVCQTIEASGIRSIQLGFANPEVLDTAFIGYNYANCFSKPQDIQWLTDYNNGKGSFGDHFTPALDLFQYMIDVGIWQRSDLNISYADRERMLFTRQCAMVEDAVLLTHMGHQQTGTNDEFALLPFFNPGKNGDWARIYMVCYIGANKHLLEPKNKNKYDLVLQILDYISTPEGQEALASDTGTMFSSLIGTKPLNVPEIQDLLPALNQGRYTVFSPLKNAQNALRNGLTYMLHGTADRENIIKMIDKQNLSPALPPTPRIIGKASKNFTLIETGNFVTDAMRSWSHSDVALFLDNGQDGLFNGKGISGKIYEGNITDIDLGCILPDMKYGERGVLCYGKTSGANLIKILEYTIPVGHNQTGWFYYFSGLRMKYDPSAPPGQRIKSITLANGEKLNKNALYSIAAMDHTLPEEYLQDYKTTNTTITEILEYTIQHSDNISPALDNRFILSY